MRAVAPSSSAPTSVLRTASAPPPMQQAAGSGAAGAAGQLRRNAEPVGFGDGRGLAAIHAPSAHAAGPVGEPARPRLAPLPRRVTPTPLRSWSAHGRLGGLHEVEAPGLSRDAQNLDLHQAGLRATNGCVCQTTARCA